MRCLTSRSIALLASVSLLGLSLVSAPSSSRAARTNRYVSGELLMKLVRTSALHEVASHYGLDPVPIDRFGSAAIYRLRILDGTSPYDKANEVLGDPQGRVIYAEPNFLGEPPEGEARVTWSVGGSTGDYVAQWAPRVIRLERAQSVTRGAGITVAVLDTGVDLTHPVLAGKLVSGFDFVDSDRDPSEVGNHTVNPTFGHGTHVAGLVALVAPDTKIMPLRVLDADGVGNVWLLAKALAFAMDPDGNPATNDNVNVINLSLATSERSKMLRDVIKAVICNDNNQNQSPNDLPCFSLAGRGAVIAAAAGNDASSTPRYPAAEGRNGMVAVGASTQADTIAAFSNFGSWVDVLAPGEGILSSVPGGIFGTWSGTSMSTPLVAGEAALVRARFPSLKPAKVAERIIEESAEIDGPVPLRIDAAAAVGAAHAH